MGNLVRRQHTVSRFYLRGFSDDRDQVSRVQLPGDKIIKMTINDATVVKDFYSIDLPDGTSSDMFERAFSEVEGPASSAFASLLDGTWPLTAEHRESLSAWIALQQLRGEEPRASQTDVNGQFIRLIVGTAGKEALRRHIEAAENRTVDDAELNAEWEDLTKPGGPDLVPDVTGHMRLVMDVWPGLAAYLEASHWTLVRFQRKSLVTSDHPVTMAVDESESSFYGVGLATADLFSVPLARRLALNIQPRRRFEQYPVDPNDVADFAVAGTVKFANSLNQQTVSQARRYIYMHPEDVLDSRIHIPPPTERSNMQMSGGDDLIREEGLYAGVDFDPRPASTGTEERGVSLGDLPWPIPRRKPLDLK